MTDLAAQTSVVVPCHDNAAFVGTAIASILAQTRPPGEIVVVDDGSRDGSRAVIEGFGAQVRVVHQANRGAAAARNAGIAASRGALIAFLDADDAWPADSLAQRLDALAETGADLVFGRVAQCDAALGRLGPATAGRLAGALLVRRTVLDRIGGFDERLRTAETIDWVARAEDAGCTTAATGAVVLLRRIHGGNLMLRARGPARDCLGVLRTTLARRRLAGAS